MPRPEPMVTPIEIEHVRITAQRPFADVRARIEAELPRLDPAIMTALASGEREAIRPYEKPDTPLYLFLDRDHGEILASAGCARNAVQYEIGNPITATMMTRHHLGAALYAPLRVALFETDSGEVVFEYDRPSTLFGQFGDARVNEIARMLDRELESALIRAAGR